MLAGTGSRPLRAQRAGERRRARTALVAVCACALLLAFSISAGAQKPAAKTNIDPNMQALADTERAFAALGAEKGVRESFMKYFAPDGIWFVPHPKKTVEDLRSRPAPTAPLTRKLEWAPEFGDVSRAGDLGWDTGPSRNSDLTGKTPPRYSYFFSIWKKQPDSTWRVLLDLGTDVPQAWDPAQPPVFTQAAASGWKGKAKGDAAAEVAALKSTEAKFSEAARAKGMAAVSAEFMDATARLHRNGFSPLRGRDAVRAFLAQHDTKARWEPMAAEVAKSSDLGYTWGRIWAPGWGKDGAEFTGYYVHVWRKDARGAWKLVFHVTIEAPFDK